ncbi:Ejaculatory bulb-specific protein 3 [Eumeta japonica]|uniref:Ejaculatory bulb-specific protein 3 n=1 Tax=Eumeta variegata TaxID=151549 RepID=A0A4C1T041_EUMVA|nr:Ejaculatory bulb-specific protein 3 [Eumeta japonica]
MKFVITLMVLGIAVATPQNYKMDVSALDIEGVLNNPEKMKTYYNCLLDLGECNPIAAAVKSQLPQILETSCAKCTSAQKQVIRRILRSGREQLPEETEKLIKKYDPEGKYKDKIEKFINSTD